MAQFRDFYFTFMTDEEFNVIEGTIEDFLDWTFDTDEDEEPFLFQESFSLPRHSESKLSLCSRLDENVHKRRKIGVT